MEHKLLRGGGEQYLPFARSRIKALQATGLQYASQRFDMGDAKVSVRIEPGQEYIDIEGGISILSGVTKGGALITLPDDRETMRSFRATVQAKEYAKGGSTTVFHDMKRLAVKPHANFLPGGQTQYEHLCASMFSGTMAKVVQILMGYGKDGPATGKQIQYRFEWAICHGVVTASDDRKWLVEISKDDGVRAMLLPMRRKKPGSEVQDVLRETCALLGGFPTGGTFPTGAKLVAAIADGKVLQLLSAAGLYDYYANKLPYSWWMGWSFNNSGSEAHHTCVSSDNGIYNGDLAVNVVSHHFRLDITIGEDSGTATLTEVESGPLLFAGTKRCIAFGDLFGGHFEACPGKRIGDSDPRMDVAMNTPVLVCHINDVLDVVRIKSNGANRTEEINLGAVPPYPPTYAYRFITDYQRYVVSTTYPDDMNFYKEVKDISSQEYISNYGYRDYFDGGTTSYFERIDERFAAYDMYAVTETCGLSHCIWSPIARDCYVIDRNLGQKKTNTIHQNLYYAEFAENGYKIDGANGPGSLTVSVWTGLTLRPVWAAGGGWVYTPPVGVWGGTDKSTIIGGVGAAQVSDPVLGSGSFTYPTPNSHVTVIVRPASRPLTVVTAPGHTVNPLNEAWSNAGLGEDWAYIHERDLPFEVRYSVFGDLPQIAYPASTVGDSPTAVVGTAFLSDPSPGPIAEKYSFIGYVK